MVFEGICFINVYVIVVISIFLCYFMFMGEYVWCCLGMDVVVGNVGMIICLEDYMMVDMFKNFGYVIVVFGKWYLGLGDKSGE